MSDYPIDAAARLAIAQSLVGPIDPRGYCRCPGAKTHSNKSGPQRPDRPGRDCRVYLAKSDRNPRGVPSISCVHTSCEGAVSEVNRRLRSEIAKHEAAKAKTEGYVFAPPTHKRRTREEIDAARQEKARKALALRSREARGLIIQAWPWERVDMWSASDPLPESDLQQARAVLRLFGAADVVWCGAFKDSIAPEDVEACSTARVARVRGCFRSCADWLRSAELPGPRIVPSAFVAGGTSRSKEAVRQRRLLVIEHDHLSIPEQGAMLRWLWEKAGLSLRAIVFTGNKSIHGWFDAPPAADMPELETVLTAMGYDPASFNPAQPYPLPGWPHPKTGIKSELWFLRGGSTGVIAPK